MASSRVTVCSGLRDARGPVSSRTRPSSIDCLHRGDDELDAELGDGAVAELDDLVEVVAGVDVHHRERDARRPERPVGEVEHDDGVLAAGEQQHGPLALGGDLADDRDRLVLELGGGGGRRRGTDGDRSRESSAKSDRESQVFAGARRARTLGRRRPARSWRAVTVDRRRPASARTTHVASTRSGVPSCPCVKRIADRPGELAELHAGPGRRRPSTPSPASSATIGRTRSSLAARAETCVGSQPVLAMPTSTRHVPPPRSTAPRVTDLQARRRQRLGDGELGVAARPRPAAGRAAGSSRCPRYVPAAELDRAELRVLERVPVDELVGGVLVDPAQHGERLLVGRARRTRSRSPASSPVAACDDVPELGRPREHAEVLVGPVVGGAAHRVGLVPREVLEHGVHRVAGERACRSRRAASTPTRRRGGSVESGCGRRRPQQHAAAGVEGVVAADVGPGDDGPHEGVDLRLRQRVVAGAAHAASPQPAGKLRLRSRPSGGRGVGIVNPSWSTTVPSSSSR